MQNSPASQASKPGDTPSTLHYFPGLLPRFNKTKGEWMYEGRVRQPGSDTKVFVGSSSSMKLLARRVGQCKGPRRVCMQAPEVHA